MLLRAKLLLRRVLFHPNLCARIFGHGSEMSGVFQRTRRREADAFLLRQIGSNWMVRAGPFAGLRYPALQSHGSALVPKLLGTYEAELHPVWRHIFTQPITHICDVGSAEGYYAIGLARRFESAHVEAYDIDPLARESCRAMSVANTVSDRVVVLDCCDPSRLLALPAKATGLLVMDCEGAECELLTPAVLRQLVGWHAVIELHGPLTPESWTTALRAAAAGTHDAELIHAWSDEVRAARGSSAHIDLRDPIVRLAAFSENRPAGMSWLVLRPRV
jgi:hypothetical protein